jgi:hypothetical protein
MRTLSSGSWTVTKATLVQRVAVAMEQGRLKITCDEAMPKVFDDEARAFVRLMNSLGNVTYDMRGDEHDDMVLAVALAMWARAESSVAKGLFAA